MPRIDTTAWVRIGAGAFVVLAIAATALEIGREGKEPETFPVPVAAATVSDPLATELERCKTIAPASGLDEACERVWASSRRRFFGPPSASVTPAGARP